MCALNPAFKKRIIFDVYTSDTHFTEKEFEDQVLAIMIIKELELNSVYPRLRFHVKETDQEAE